MISLSLSVKLFRWRCCNRVIEPVQIKYCWCISVKSSLLLWILNNFLSIRLAPIISCTLQNIYFVDCHELLSNIFKTKVSQSGKSEDLISAHWFFNQHYIRLLIKCCIIRNPFSTNDLFRSFIDIYSVRLALEHYRWITIYLYQLFLFCEACNNNFHLYIVSEMFVFIFIEWRLCSL